jgi:hypothetical protein
MQLTRGWRASRLGLFKKISTARRRSNWCIWGCSVMHTNGLESSIWRGPSGRSSSACSVRDLPVIQRHGLVFHSIKIRIVETLFFIFGNHFSLQYFRLTSLHSMKLHFLGPSWFSAFFRNACHICALYLVQDPKGSLTGCISAEPLGQWQAKFKGEQELVS